VGQQFAAPAYNPIADVMALMGVQSNGPWQNLAAFAPAVDQFERGARTIGGMGIEMTGIPAAQRAGEAAAAGRLPEAVGEAAMALPGRLASIPGVVVSEATAQATADPRQRRIDTLTTDINKARDAITAIGARQPRIDSRLSGRARAEAEAAAAARLRTLTAPHQKIFEDLSAQRKALQDELDGERRDAAARKLAEEIAAQWRNTPSAQAYPTAQYASAGAGALGSGYLAFRGARRPVMQFNQRIADIVTRQRAAVAQANDTTLSATQRNQARRTAQAAQAEYDAAIANQPHLTVGNRLTTGGLSGAATDLGMALPTFADYTYSSTQGPEGQPLRDYSLHQLNPIENPGRFGAGFLGGAFAGMLGQEIGEQFPGVRIPPGLQAETEGLPGRYQNPRAPGSRPRKRK
jgi:hypothetical protein